MCRWLAYFGDPIPIEWVVLQPKYALLVQSLPTRLGTTTINRDGFGLGWYSRSEQPGLYRSVHPAWNDRIRYGSWMFMHNGSVRELPGVKRDLRLEVEPSLLPWIEGSSNSELLFYLTLTFGLQQDPVAALERMVGFVVAIGERHGIEHPLQMAAAVSNGKQIVWVKCRKSGRKCRSRA